jgi:hypothetical protein
MKLKIFVKTIILLASLFTLHPVYAATETVDVLVLYDNAATSVKQGNDMPVAAASFVEFANATYKNSSVNIKLRIVHLEKIAISGGNNVSSTALNSLANNQKVQELREKYGADLVALLTLRRNVGGGFVCGIGYVPRGNEKLTSAAKSAGFSVSAINCDNTTFVHELGHNMALGHSVAQGSTGGVFRWGRGHGERNNFVTTMAYTSAYGSAVRVQQFSSPDHVKCNGSPCGVAHDKGDAADAVASLNVVAKQVSEFYPTKVPGTDVPDEPTPPVEEPTPPVEEPTPPVEEPTPKDSENIVTNGNFDSLDSWRNYKELSSLELSEFKYSSKFGLKIYDRQSIFSGPVQTIPIEVGKTYQFSAQAALATQKATRNLLFAVLRLTTSRGEYYKLLDAASIVRGQWSKLERASFTVTKAYGKVDTAELLFFGPWRGRDFYLDEVVIKAK